MGFQSGQRIGQYIIQDFLARGGMGVVWRARDSKNGRQVAIKVVADECINVSNFEQRFADEASRQSRLTHPNIVPVFAAFRFRDNYCMVMELIEGTSLDALLRNSKDHRLEMGLATRIMTELLSALNCAHMQGIWHRDVKPSNILLDRENHVHLADFGIALAVGEQRLTRAGVAVGTPLYMSPEQIREPLRIDHRTDVYSAGCMFYEMLTGQPPFVAAQDDKSDPDFAIKSAHLNQQPVPPIKRVPSIPPRINALILAALQKDRDRRIPGCGEFLRLLNATEADVTVGAFPHFEKRALLIATGIALVVAGVLVLAAVFA